MKPVGLLRDPFDLKRQLLSLQLGRRHPDRADAGWDSEGKGDLSCCVYTRGETLGAEAGLGAYLEAKAWL